MPQLRQPRRYISQSRPESAKVHTRCQPKRQTHREVGTQSHGTQRGSAGLPNERHTLSAMRISRTKTAAAVLAVGALAFFAATPQAMADTAESTVSGANLAVTTSGATLAGVTLNGATQTTAEAASTTAWSIKDARGTGAAWAVSVTATTPTSAAGSTELSLIHI